ncbi:MAG TPA: succinate dehydrogenase assembly factor 2 [Stellaceae bacterium]|nr:succinate dehydrogenase assembly factor 2 [Stellaceae bacterium]
MSEADAIRRKRLLFRSRHRGTREADLLYGAFADRYLAAFSPAQVDAWERLLDQDDPDLWDWLVGAALPPPELDTDVFAMLRQFRRTPGSP